MIEIVPDHGERFARAVGPDADPVLAEMADHADDMGDRYPGEDSFPTVGPAVGGWLELLARLVGARRVFEFGSGFGYSGYWFARALPPDGELVLTERDSDELDLAREFLERGDFDATVHYEAGDALETIDRYDGEFDVVLLDHENDRYPEAFEAVRGKVAPGGVLIADNVMTAAIIEFESLLRAFARDDAPASANDHTRGVYEYLTAVRADPAFTTGVIPLGGGIAVSVRRRA